MTILGVHRRQGIEWTAKAQEWKKVFEAFDAAKASKMTGAAQAALAQIAMIYRQETELRGEYSDKPETFLVARREKTGRRSRPSMRGSPTRLTRLFLQRCSAKRWDMASHNGRN